MKLEKIAFCELASSPKVILNFFSDNSEFLNLKKFLMQ